jgi:hypothetical protein
MKNSIRIIRKSEGKVSTWSGGTTTQLYIYPENAVYADRNFRWRLSSAKVAADESIFTPLTGISRILMIIEGKVSIEHQGHHSIVLKAFEKDSFSGDWTTRCIGKATDYNLMTDKSCGGCMDAFSIDSGEVREVQLNVIKSPSERFSLVTDAFYIIGSDVGVFIADNEIQHAHDGDLVMVTRQEEEYEGQIGFENYGDKKINIIRTTIYY